MKTLGSWLLIREGEGRHALFFMVLFLLMGAGVAVGKGSADALFLKRYGVQNLAYVYIGLAFALAIVSTVYAAFVDRISAERFLLALFVIQLVSLAASWLFMDVLQYSSIYPAYYVLYALSSELLILHGGVYIGQNLNTLQAKRMTPLIFGGYQLGMILGGVLLVGVIADAGLNYAPLAWAVFVVLSTLLLVWWHGNNGTSPFYFPKGKSNKGRLRVAIDEVRKGIDFTRRKDLLKNSSYALIFMVITFYMLSYCGHLIYNSTFSTEQDLLSFFGVLVISTNAAAMVLQIFVTNRVLARIGVRRTKFIYPVTTVLSFILLLVHPGFIAAVFASINRETIMPAFRNPTRQMFFNVLPEYMKGRARAISVAVVMPVAMFICGVLILVMQHYGNMATIASAGLMLSLLYAYYCVRMGRSYVVTLIESMKEKLFLPEYSPLAFKDKNADLLKALSKGLSSKNDLVSLSYAKALVQSYPVQAVDMILERVQHAENSTADQMIRLVRSTAGGSGAMKLLCHVDRGDAHLKATIYEVVSRCGFDGVNELVSELLGNPNERIRASGVRAAFSLQHRASQVTAVSVWYDLLEGSANMQYAALDLIPILDSYNGLDRDHMIELYGNCMVNLLADADEERRCNIYNLLSHWQWGLPESVSSAIRNDMQNIHPYLRGAAAKCLHLLPDDEARPRVIWRGLDDGHLDVRRSVIASLDKIYPDSKRIYFEWLVGNKNGTPRAQQMLLEALIASGAKHSMLEQVVIVKSTYAADLLSAVNFMKHHACETASCRVTAMALEERLYQVVDLALLALQPMMDSNTIAVIRAGIRSKDSRFTASADEALQCLKSKSLVNLLSILVSRDYEMTARAGFGRVFANFVDVYRWCMSLDDAWLHDCGVHAYQEIKETMT